MEYNFEFLALVLFIVVLAGILWIFEKTSEAGRNIMATLDSPPVSSDEQEVAEDLAFRNKAVYETDRYNESASMEPFCGGSDAQTKEQERRAQTEADRQARSRHAIRRAQEAARNSTVRHFAEDLSKRDDEMAKVINGIQRRVLDEQRAALDRITGKKP